MAPSTPTPPSPQSIEHLLKSMDIAHLFGTMQGQMEKMMKSSTAQMTAQYHLSPDKQKAMEAKTEAELKALREALSWASLKDIYVKVYSESFTQDEIDGMIGFYDSPSGKAVIAKMPVVMQKSMALIQPMIMQKFRMAQMNMRDYAQSLAPAPAAPAAPAAPGAAAKSG